MGNDTVNVAPLPSPSLFALTVPPCIATRCRTIASPVPCHHVAGWFSDRPVENDRKRAAESREIPWPVSLTTISRCELTRLRTNLNTTTARREFDRIREQVPNHLLQSHRIAGNRNGASVDNFLNAHALGFGSGLTASTAASINEFGSDGRTSMRNAGDDSRNVEQVVDQLRLSASVTLDRIERFGGHSARVGPGATVWPNRE